MSKAATHVNTDRRESGGHVLLGGAGVAAEHKEHVGSQVTHLWVRNTQQGNKQAGREWVATRRVL